MNPLTVFLQALGNGGAKANARAVLEARIREDWLVQALADRLEQPGRPHAVPSTASRAAA
jgi:hypothetical protein